MNSPESQAFPAGRSRAFQVSTGVSLGVHIIFMLFVFFNARLRPDTPLSSNSTLLPNKYLDMPAKLPCSAIPEWMRPLLSDYRFYTCNDVPVGASGCTLRDPGPKECPFPMEAGDNNTDLQIMDKGLEVCDSMLSYLFDRIYISPFPEGADAEMVLGAPVGTANAYDIPQSIPTFISTIDIKAHSKAIIRRVVREHYNDLKHCCHSHMANRDIKGSMTIKFAIDPSGVVTYAGVAGSTCDTCKLEQCIVKTVECWTFPSLASSNGIWVTYSFMPVSLQDPMGPPNPK